MSISVANTDGRKLDLVDEEVSRERRRLAGALVSNVNLCKNEN